jgi:hypothetical protein
LLNRVHNLNAIYFTPLFVNINNIGAVQETAPAK